MRHAHEVPALRTTSTLGGSGGGADGGPAHRPGTPRHLGAVVAAGVADAQRRGAVARDGPSTACPADLRDADGVGRIVGREPGTGATLAEDYRRLARRARSAVVSNFYEGA